MSKRETRTEVSEPTANRGNISEELLERPNSSKNGRVKLRRSFESSKEVKFFNISKDDAPDIPDVIPCRGPSDPEEPTPTSPLRLLKNRRVFTSPGMPG